MIGAIETAITNWRANDPTSYYGLVVVLALVGLGLFSRRSLWTR